MKTVKRLIVVYSFILASISMVAIIEIISKGL